MRVKVFQLKSFGVDETGGNPAGVVLNAEELSDEQRKYIAAQAGFSETAFIEKSGRADFKVRFFTPTEEVDLCGHATIAAYALLTRQDVLKPGRYTQELKAGILEIEILDNGFIFMEQSLPEFSEILEPREVNEVFGTDFVFADLKPQIVSTGLQDIMLPVVTREQLFSLQPNFYKLADLNKKTNSVGLHAFTFETLRPDSVAHCRNFAPLYGINEESATGSSCGALACYLFKYGKLKGGNLEMMRFEQGYSMQQPSEIFVTLKVGGEDIKQVLVGGRAIQIGEKTIELQRSAPTEIPR